MKIQGKKQLLTKVQKIIKRRTGLQVSVELNPSFQWEHKRNKLYFSPYWEQSEIEEVWFNWIKETFTIDNFNNTQTYYLAFLHELGHKMTLDNVTDEEYYEAQILSEETRNPILYFDSYREYIATKWAVDFIQTHPQNFEKMAKDIYKALQKFYKKNMKKA